MPCSPCRPSWSVLPILVWTSRWKPHGGRRRQLATAGLLHTPVDTTIGRPGTCWDNAVAESFFATLKNELIYVHVWPTRQSARSAIFAFIEGWYNRIRLHSTLKYASPEVYEEDYYHPQRSCLILYTKSVRWSGATPTRDRSWVG